MWLFVFYIKRRINRYRIKKAGNAGERAATHAIAHVLSKDDILLTNVCIEYEGKETELDDVIVNSHGVFIVEVKNYSGRLYGRIDDREWVKRKVSGGGNIYEKRVRNPIPQVNRQVYILSHYLKEHGVKVWVEGYVFFVENNCPVADKIVLRSYHDIDVAIHGRTNQKLDKNEIRKIKDILI